MNTREKLLKEEREKMPLDKRQVVALEQIADTLSLIHSELLRPKIG